VSVREIARVGSSVFLSVLLAADVGSGVREAEGGCSVRR
jgi:hypothetical protein